MPPIYYLNPPPNPFWGFVTDIQDHPFFNAYGRPQPTGQTQAAGPEAATEGTASANAQQEKADDPPEVDPSTLRAGNEQGQEARDIPFRGRGRFAGAFGEDDRQAHEGHERRGCGRRARGGFEGPWAQPPFPWGRGGPFWARRPHGPPGPPGPHGPHGHHGPHGPRGSPPSPPPPGDGPHGRGGPWSRGGPQRHHHHHGPPHHPGPRGHRGPSSPHRGPRGFDLGQFLNDLGSRIGVDLQGAADGLGLNRAGPQNADADFEPKVDIFDREQDYVLHLSLPGAKKEDVGVDWDGEHSLLRVAGVVHRPNVDEQMLAQLVVDGRKRETGVFEKAIRLGTRREPASIDIAGIKAKMTDGVLIITVPKVEKQHEKRDVPIGGSQTPSPQRDQQQTVFFDADQDMSDAEPTVVNEKEAHVAQSEVSKGKQAEYEAEKKPRAASPATTIEAEQLPTYTPAATEASVAGEHGHEHEHEHDGSDWEHFASDDEGEYIKINVD